MRRYQRRARAQGDAAGESSFAQRFFAALALPHSRCAAPTNSAFAGLNGLDRPATGQNQVIALEFAPGDPNRLFIAERGGSISVFNLATNAFEPAPLIVIEDLDLEVEGGLLGLAFHPDFQSNGKFYVNVTVDNGGIPLDKAEQYLSPFSTHIREYTATQYPYVASASFVNVLDFVQPQAWHNGGWLGFGPDDGYLHVLTGDGGAAFDIGPGHTPGTGNAQDLTNNLLGKLLRIDVDGDDFPREPLRNYAIPPDNPFVGQTGDDEIFAYGFRNPWQASFDRATGDLWIGDVGEATREEIDVIPAGSGGGQNFGWNQREGSIASPVGGPLPGSVDPVYDYERRGGPGNPALQGNSVTGGFVYRGPDPDLYGKYLFGDFVSAQVWMFDPADAYGTVQNITAELPPSAGQLRFLTTFGEDAAGNLYIGTIQGDVYRIVTDRIMGDFDSDGYVDAADLDVWAESFGTVGEPGNIYGDMDGDGDVDGAGVLLWQRYLGYEGLPPPSVEPGNEPVPEPAAILVAAAAILMSCGVLRGARRERSPLRAAQRARHNRRGQLVVARPIMSRNAIFGDIIPPFGGCRLSRNSRGCAAVAHGRR